MKLTTLPPVGPIRGTLLSALLLFFGFATAFAAPEFETDYEKAVAKAKKSDKPLIVIFSASWCPPCQQMKKSVYPSEEIEPYHDDFVWTYLDADLPENGPIASTYRVSGIPHIAFLLPDGTPAGHFAGAVSPDQFKGILDQVIDASEKKATTTAEES